MSSLLTLLLAAAASAYSPETLLQKISTAPKEIEAPGGNQYLNPFSSVSVGFTQLDLAAKEHEYSLQVSPKSLKEAKAYRQFARSLENEAELARKITLSRGLQISYATLVNAALAREQLAFTRDWQSLMEKTQRLSALEARRAQTDIKNVLRASKDLQKSSNDMITTQAQVAGVSRFLESYGLKLAELDVSGLLTPAEMLARVESAKEVKGLTADKIRSELEVERADLKHSLAKNGHLLDDVKFAVRQEKREVSYRVEVSFNLPFLAAQDLGEVKDKMKLAENETEAEQSLLEESQRTAGLVEVLRQKAALFASLGDTAAMEKATSSLLRQDPALALELQKSVLERRLLKATLLAEIRSLYLTVLYENGTLAAQPGVNLLSRESGRI